MGYEKPKIFFSRSVLRLNSFRRIESISGQIKSLSIHEYSIGKQVAFRLTIFNSERVSRPHSAHRLPSLGIVRFDEDFAESSDS